MSAEHEKLKKDLNIKGTKLLNEIIDVMSMKSHSNRAPYPVTVDNLHVGIKGKRITVQGKQDVKIHCGFVVEDSGKVFLVHNTLATKELSATRAEAIKKAYDGITGLFTVFNVTPHEIALESNGGKVALVANTSQGRVAIVG